MSCDNSIKGPSQQPIQSQFSQGRQIQGLPEIGSLPNGSRVSSKVDPHVPVEEKIKNEADKHFGKPPGNISNIRSSTPRPLLARQKGIRHLKTIFPNLLAKVTPPANAAQYRAQTYSEKVRTFENSDTSILKGLVEGVRNKPTAKAADVRPLMEMFFKQIYNARAHGITSDAHLKNLFDSLTNTPQAKQLLKNSSSFKKQHRAVQSMLDPKKPSNASNIALNTGFVSLQIANGNIEVADFSNLSLAKLAPSLGEEMRMTEGGADANTVQARKNLIAYTSAKLDQMDQQSIQNLSGEDRASLVMGVLRLVKSAKAQGLAGAEGLHADLVKKFPAVVDLAEANPLATPGQLFTQSIKTSVQEFIKSMVSAEESQELKEAFILAANSIPWGKGDLKGIDLFEQFHVVYPTLTPLEQNNVLRLLADYVNENASLPTSIAGQTALKNQIHALLNHPDGPLDPDAAAFSTLSAYVVSPAYSPGPAAPLPAAESRTLKEFSEMARVNYRMMSYKFADKKPEEIASDLASLQEDVFLNVSLSGLETIDDPSRLKAINLFNEVAENMVFQILFCDDNDRQGLFNKLVEVAAIEITNHRYESAMVIISALNHSAVTRLLLEPNLPPELKGQLGEVETLLNPGRNYAAAREAMKSALTLNKPVLPIMGPTFKDLTFVQENPSISMPSETAPLGEFNRNLLLLCAKSKRGISDYMRGLKEHRTQGSSDKNKLDESIRQTTELTAKAGGQSEAILYKRSEEIKPKVVKKK